MYLTREEIQHDHSCACSTCDPSLMSLPQRQGPQHIGVRFWDENPEERARDRNAMILLNGVEIAGVFEAVLREHGSIWRYRGVPSESEKNRHLCQTCLKNGGHQIGANGGFYPVEGVPSPGICQEILKGSVELRARPTTL